MRTREPFFLCSVAQLGGARVLAAGAGARRAGRARVDDARMLADCCRFSSISASSLRSFRFVVSSVALRRSYVAASRSLPPFFARIDRVAERLRRFVRELAGAKCFEP